MQGNTGLPAAYSAFGIPASGSAGTGGPWGFGAQWGYYMDSETGLILCTHRYYDPYTGRFLNRDPDTYNGGINLYNHVANNPINYADPDGMSSPGVAEPPTEVELPRVPGQASATILKVAGGTLRLVGMTCGFALYFIFASAGPAGGPGDELPNPPGPAKTNCATAKKLLKESASRLAQKYNVDLNDKRVAAMRAKIANGTITSYDLPGTMQRRFPGEFIGWSLERIEKYCGSN